MAIRSRKINSSFLIGLFVVTGTIILVGFLIWMGATQFLKEQTFYVTYFDGSIEGLEPGSAVKYLGVPCGRVQRVQVAPDGRLVEVIMNIDEKITISDSLRVKAEMAGIAGGKFLQLFIPSDPQMFDMHPKINFNPPYTLIKSAPSGIEEITLAARDVMNNIMKLQFAEISKGTINFLDATTKFFTSPELNKIVEELAQSSERLNAVLAQADTSNIITNLSYSSYKLNETVNELKHFSTMLNTELEKMQLPYYVSRIYEKYDSTMVNTNRSISTITYRMQTILFGLNETFEELRQTNRALQRSLRAITDNPSQIFLSEPPPPEK
ncbi:MAG TPA: MlaD family protein [Candidatus Kapabacteria bacterium]|jgi:phospholipid/cholesterol/gamma-HCH transport system substrate-binding protein|nr:MlaD family protein [Candidatus Kapabacteria bacterium]HPP40228.1 MlaD family protein [Candidatus Kapabacteria bacterium]HPU23558.1 MlaD family protein [Candidatus Kapabacteria bacterium]